MFVLTNLLNISIYHKSRLNRFVTCNLDLYNNYLRFYLEKNKSQIFSTNIKYPKYDLRLQKRRNSLVSQVIRLQLHFREKRFGHLQNYRSILASNCMTITFYDYSKIIRVSFCFYGSSPDSTPDPFSIEPERQGGGRSTRYYANSSFNSAR